MAENTLKDYSIMSCEELRQEIKGLNIAINNDAIKSDENSLLLYKKNQGIALGEYMKKCTKNPLKQSLPIKPVSKNLTPYIYAGVGIVAILIIARIIAKK